MDRGEFKKELEKINREGFKKELDTMNKKKENDFHIQYKMRVNSIIDKWLEANRDQNGSIPESAYNTKIVVLLEELSELSIELTKFYKNEGSIYGLMEEMADVYICMSQIRELLYPALTDENIKNAILIKLKRHEERCAQNEV